MKKKEKKNMFTCKFSYNSHNQFILVFDMSILEHFLAILSVQIKIEIGHKFFKHKSSLTRKNTALSKIITQSQKNNVLMGINPSLY